MRVTVACVCIGCGSGSSGTGDPGPTDAGEGATVTGTLTLPGVAADKPWSVRLYDSVGVAGAAPASEASGRTGDGTTVAYSMNDVPAGSFFLLGFVDVDESGGFSSTSGDYTGWYGHTGDGNPPAEPNVVVPESGTVSFEFTLVER